MGSDRSPVFDERGPRLLPSLISRCRAHRDLQPGWSRSGQSAAIGHSRILRALDDFLCSGIHDALFSDQKADVAWAKRLHQRARNIEVR